MRITSLIFEKDLLTSEIYLWKRETLIKNIDKLMNFRLKLIKKSEICTCVFCGGFL